MPMVAGIVSFGTHVYVHELEETTFSRVNVFRGSGDYSTSLVAAQLGLRSVSRHSHSEVPGASRYIVSLDKAEYQIEAALEALQVRFVAPELGSALVMENAAYNAWLILG